jgi:hypothetical protein
MALTKDENSYVNLDEANTYFEDRLDVAAWDAAPDTQKQQALVTATGLLDSLRWEGFAVSDTQALAFPRIGVYFDPRLGYQIAFPEGYPKRLLLGTYELAYHLLNNDGLLDNTGSVKTLKLGSIDLQNINVPSLIPASVKRQVQPMLLNGGALNWWRAN